MFKKYTTKIEEKMKQHYDELNEKEKRRYSAVEAIKLGHGSKTYIASIVKCDRKTISKGIKELDKTAFSSGKVRKPGGGRKNIIDNKPEIEAIFNKVIEEHTAGSPMSDTIWTHLEPVEIAALMSKEKEGLKVSPYTVKQLLKKGDYKYRKMQKDAIMSEPADRDAQFINIEKLKAEYGKSDNPIISIDVKKKEQIGNFYRDGKQYSKDAIKVYDHDFPSFADGIVIPHGIYDVKKNIGYINIGTSKDTSEFCCDCIRDWWLNYGKYEYPNANSILILADGGGSNSSRHYIFKYDLENLVNELGIAIRIAHYPPYTSKYNPIEHRLFCHVTKACTGVVFKTVDIVKKLMEKTKTKTGLKVFVNVISKVYALGRKYPENFKENMTIIFDNLLGKWNYSAIPKIC